MRVCVSVAVAAAIADAGGGGVVVVMFSCCVAMVRVIFGQAATLLGLVLPEQSVFQGISNHTEILEGGLKKFRSTRKSCGSKFEKRIRAAGSLYFRAKYNNFDFSQPLPYRYSLCSTPPPPSVVHHHPCKAFNNLLTISKTTRCRNISAKVRGDILPLLFSPKSGSIATLFPSIQYPQVN
jgi:hypothetical protein